MPAEDRPSPAPHPEALSPIDMSSLVVHLIRCPAVFSAARDLLQSEMLRADPAYRAVYDALLIQARARPLGQITESMLMGEVENAAQARNFALTGDDWETAVGDAGIINFAYKFPEADLRPDYYMGKLRDFLANAEGAAGLRNLAAAQRGECRLEDVLDDCRRRVARVKSLGASASISAVSDDLSSTRIVITSTGVPFVDPLMDGGQSGGEVYGLMAPYGQGKTTLGNMLATRGAERFRREHRAGGPHKVSFFVSYEDGAKKLAPRIRSFGAEISRQRLTKEILDWADLSRTGDLLPYEVEMYNHRGTPPGLRVGEFERLRAFNDRTQGYFDLIDYSGSGESFADTAAGTGGVEEIAASLATACRASGREVGMVVIDYCGVAVRRELTAKGGNVDTHTRHYIAGYADRVRRWIAAPMDCPVWVIHQLAGAVRDTKTFKLPSSTDAAECKMFAENLDFCFMLGSPSGTHHILPFGCDKARRAEVQGQVIPVKVIGNLGKIVSVAGTHELDVTTNTYVPIGENRGVRGLGEDAGRSARNAAGNPFTNPPTPYDVGDGS